MNANKPQCYICFYKIKDNQKKTLTCSFGHVFHMKCIWKWLVISNNCPLCRETVKSYPDYQCPYNEYIHYVNALVSKK